MDDHPAGAGRHVRPLGTDSYYQTGRGHPSAMSYYPDYGDGDIDVGVSSRHNPTQPSVTSVSISDSSNDEDDGSRYDYAPSYGSAPGTTSNEKEVSSDSAATSLEPTNMMISRVKTHTDLKWMHVHESKYTGRGSPGGPHSLSLVLLHEPGRLQQTLFRWG